MATSICRNPKLLFSKALFSTATQNSPLSSFRAAKSAILSESNPDKLAELFEQSAHFPVFRRHRPIFHHSFRKLARARRPDLIQRLLQSQQNDLSSPLIKSEGFWIRLLMLYSNAGMLDEAMETLNHFSQNRYFNLSEKSLCAILSAHLKNEMFDQVHQLFETMPKTLGVKPGPVSNNLVLKAFVGQNKMESARDWIQKIERDGYVAPNIDSYNILLGAYLKSEKMSEFDRLLKEVLNKGLECSLTTYVYRILRLSKSNECVRANKLLDEMVSRGVKPNSACYNTIIHGFCRMGDFESAKKVLESMLARGYVSPCSFTFYTFIRNTVKEGDFELALEMFKEIVKRKWVPPFEATEGLVRGLLKMSREGEAREVVEKMKKRLRGEALQSWGKIEAALPL